MFQSSCSSDTDFSVSLPIGHVLGSAIPSDGVLSDQIDVLRGLLLEFQGVFSKGNYDLGCFTEIKHAINTGDFKPVKLPLWRTPLGFEGEENLKMMLDVGVIQESYSDWASAPVLVRKRDGSVKYCIDFHELNHKTVKDYSHCHQYLHA